MQEIEQLLNNTDNMNRQSMGGGEILRMILMEQQKNQVENEDPIRPKTGLVARDISEIDSLIFAERSDDEAQVQRYSDDVLHEDSEEFSEQVQRTNSR